jgi:hypothetical protein
VNNRDSKRYDALRELGCIAGIIAGVPCYGAKVDIHHLVDRGYRRLSGGNQATIPLCRWHHVGEPPIDYTVGYMHAVSGPSMYWHSKEFTATYGSQRTLLARVNEMLSGAKGGIEGAPSPHDTATCPLADCPDCESERGEKHD